LQDEDFDSLSSFVLGRNGPFIAGSDLQEEEAESNRRLSKVHLEAKSRSGRNRDRSTRKAISDCEEEE
jgi:hypothetical protein